jgi:merozoite surface antigen 2c
LSPISNDPDRYSGVRREYAPLPAGQPNKYTPPARRPPSGQPTISGAPVDPAIISASLSKSEKSDKAEPPKGKENQSLKKPVPSPLSKSPKPEESSKPPATTSTAKATLEKVLPSQSKAAPAAKEGGATATVEKDVVNAFKAFTATEKLRAQEHQRAAAKRDKAVKLNDLKKFAQNFKLHTPVPQDLVPILAKDKEKQIQIVENALKNTQDFTVVSKTSSEATTPAPVEAKTTKPTAPRTQNVATTPSERQSQRPKQSPNNFSQSTRNNGNQQVPTMPRTGPSQFSQNLRQQYPRPAAVSYLQDPRIPAGPAMSAGITSPPGGRLQYTPKVPEFKPNPSANTFQPHSSSGSSPVHEQKVPRPGNFFANRPPIVSPGERVSIKDNFNIIKVLLTEAKTLVKEQQIAVALNGGILRQWTPPTWDVPEENQNKTYNNVFERPMAPSISPHNMGMNHHSMPHQHQLPMNLQSGGVSTSHTPHQTPRHAPVQPHMGPNGHQHYDEHAMRYSHSSSTVQPSPRAMQPYIASHGQVQPHPVYQQAMPGYGMSPGGYPMAMRQPSGGPQFMAPSGPAMGGHMMTHQHSAGPYMNTMNAQGQVYSPVPNQAYPHHNSPMPQQPGVQGYPSPRPPAQLMAHQGSQQGHPQMMYPVQHAPGGYAQPPTGPSKSLHQSFPL